MKWLFDPKAFITRLLMIWMLLLAAYIALLVIVTWLVRYWYLTVGFLVFCGGVWLALRWIRRRFDRW